MEDGNVKVDLGKVGRELVGWARDGEGVVAIFGHKEAGKSVVIDLLAGREMKSLYNSEISSTIIVEKNNQHHIYQPIHTQRQGKQLLFECFTLQQQVQDAQPGTQLFKLALLETAIKTASKLSLVIVIQDSQMTLTLMFLQRFLYCIGINGTKKHPKIDSIKQCITLIFTKAQGNYEETEQLLRELIESTDNENVKEIVEYSISKKAISLWKVEAPGPEFVKELRNSLSPKPFNREQMTSILNQSILKDKKLTLQNEDSEAVIQLISSLPPVPTKEEEIKSITCSILFIQSLLPYLDKASLPQPAKKKIAQFQEVVRMLNDLSKPKPKPKAPLKKGAFYNFKQVIEQKCSTNKEAIDLCLNTIKDKERQEKYDHFDVIHYIKLLRDLLQEFDYSHPSGRKAFGKELLELALYTEDYHDFQIYLRSALVNKEFTEKEAIQWTKQLFSLGKYEYCEQVVDHLITESINDANFERLVALKASIKGKIHEERKGEKVEVDKVAKKKELALSLNDILSKKGRGGQLQTYMKGKTFENHIRTI